RQGDDCSGQGRAGAHAYREQAEHRRRAVAGESGEPYEVDPQRPFIQARDPHAEVRWGPPGPADRSDRAVAAHPEIARMANAAYTDGRAEHAWNEQEISWGVWNTPASEVNVLPDVRGKDVVDLGC